MIVTLATQVAFSALYMVFAGYYILGRDYDAAVMVTGCCVFGLGAMLNGVSDFWLKNLYNKRHNLHSRRAVPFIMEILNQEKLTGVGVPVAEFFVQVRYCILSATKFILWF